MAYGSHWEWRGFGGVDSTFADRFSGLNTIIDQHTVEDYYLYFSGLKTNIKIRKGPESGLKFKRAGISEGDFEQWTEHENELFDFPVPEKGQNLLRESLNSTDLEPEGPFPSELKTAEDIISWFKQIGGQVIEVHKTRETREWSNLNGTVLVEWACLSRPQPIVSISLESESFNTSGSDEDSECLNHLKSAYHSFELSKLPLLTNNYLEALNIWAKGNKI